MNQLDPQLKGLLEQFQADAAQHPAPAASLSANEKTVAIRQEKKDTFVLVHGAWFGAWVWRDVASGLREMGRVVTTPTLTGVGERRHLGNGTTSLSTHIEDVAIHVEMEDLQEIVLVGWSYGGLVTAGVLPRIEHRMKSIIYLDSFYISRMEGPSSIPIRVIDEAGWRSIEGTIRRFLHFHWHSWA